ncbi:hypothetical protein [Paenibacillus xanthanilyticus]|uniref:Lipoprotein n=1 Tax=Paenibacillus xanthanilyticus TaxID=1783531 RepID=A0ABV8KE29_9BACL
MRRVNLRYKVGFLLLICLLASSCTSGEPKGRTQAELYQLAHGNWEEKFYQISEQLKVMAWESLSDEERQTVVGGSGGAYLAVISWAEVPDRIKGILTEQPIYKVSFKSMKGDEEGAIGIYFDPINKIILGYDDEQATP